MYPVYWQLEYGAGLLHTEPPEGETILHAPKGYTGLRLCDVTGQALTRIDIPKGGRAIFYRNLSAGFDGKGSRLDATVFGCAVGENEGQITLWMWNGKEAVNVPEQHIARGAIKHQLTAEVGL